MSDLRERYLGQIKALESVSLPQWHWITSRLLIGAICLIMALLWFIPWTQTAFGDGQVDTPFPSERIQSISALVPGQIRTWHVTEGQAIRTGDPIVTLVDSDPELIQRLESQLAAANQQRIAMEQAIATETTNLDRQQRLRDQGLKSQRDLELVQLEIQKLSAEAAKIDAEISRLQVETARQSLQTKVAPSDGTILRLKSSGNATYVNAGEVLASFIPNVTARTVVLSVSGLDAPLVYPGRQVRLQFEGWPVFQFSGWPENGIGTFGGIVDFIEPVADATGRFNVWVRPDPEDQAWPDTQYARLGSRVKGWILLEEVRLGYELWRQLNNFPPQQKPSGKQ